MRQRPILFIGDMHIGRRPESLASLLTSTPQSMTTRSLSPAAAWERAISHAINIEARAVVLAGDVVDRERDLIEAYSVVERGALRLQRAGIPLFAIAGNHDAQLLPRIAEAVESAYLLGAGGTWERRVLDVGGPPVELIGWSFPAASVRESPLAEEGLAKILAEPRAGTRLLTVHGDLDVSDSIYAPLSGTQLRALDVDAAFLGHIHKPDPLNGPRPVGYLGSLVGLDRGETGLHGPVEVRVSDDGAVHARRVSLGPLRWESLDVDVTGASVGDAFEVFREIDRRVNAFVVDELGGSNTAHGFDDMVLAVRARLVGRRPIDGWRRAMDGLGGARRALSPPGRTDVWAIVAQVDDETLPDLDLPAIARERTPAGQLARFILGELELAEDAVGEAVRSWESAWHSESLQPPPDCDSVKIEPRLRLAAGRLLEQMIEARRAEGAA